MRTAALVLALAAGRAAADPDHLSRAADALDRGDDAAALPHLRAYLAGRPDAVFVRTHLAEVLLRLGRPADAGVEFATVAADPDLTGPAGRKQRLHCHARLMALAERAGDRSAEELHRGVGLWLLVCGWDADPDRRDEAAAERALALAAAALRSARAEEPADPRAGLYLAEVYRRLGQPGAARTAAAAADRWDRSLTPAERARLAELAGGDTPSR